MDLYRSGAGQFIYIPINNNMNISENIAPDWFSVNEYFVVLNRDVSAGTLDSLSVDNNVKLVILQEHAFFTSAHSQVHCSLWIGIYPSGLILSGWVQEVRPSASQYFLLCLQPLQTMQDGTLAGGKSGLEAILSRASVVSSYFIGIMPFQKASATLRAVFDWDLEPRFVRSAYTDMRYTGNGYVDRCVAYTNPWKQGCVAVGVCVAVRAVTHRIQRALRQSQNQAWHTQRFY